MQKTKLYVQIEEILLDSFDSGEQYGDWSESHSFEPTGVSLNNESNEEFEIIGDIKSGSEVHVLWCTYSSGDSFGHSEGNGQILWVFTDPNLAEMAKIMVYKYKEQVSIKFNIEDGKEVKISNPGYGYFDNLDTIELTSFVVKTY